MEPVSVLALINTCFGITSRIGTITKQIWTLKEKYKQIEWKVLLFETQLSAISTAVIGLSGWLEGPGTHDEPIRQELKRSLDSCEIVILVITEYLDKVQMQANKMNLWNKTKFLRDEGTITEYERMLRGQVQALSLLLHILSLPSRREQQSQMDRFETTSILNQARDNSSSLLWLRDAESARTVTSLATENLETVDMTFDFDELIVTSKVYRSTLASFLKQKIRGDKKSARHTTTGTTSNFPTQGDYSQDEIVLVTPAQIPSGRRPAPQRIVDSYFARWPLDASSASNGNESSKPEMSINARLPSGIPTSSNDDTSPRNEAKTDVHEAVLDQNVFLKPLALPFQHSLAYLERWPFDISTVGEVQLGFPDSGAERSIGEEEKGRNQDDPTSGTEIEEVEDNESPPSVASPSISDGEIGIEEGENNESPPFAASPSILDGEIEEGEDNESPPLSVSPSISDGEIDFEFAYSLHTFIATTEDQANTTKGDALVLLDDSNSYWWLVRVIKDRSIGYLPAEHVETPIERLARLNKHRNIDVTGTLPGDGPTMPLKLRVKVLQKNKRVKAVRFDFSLTFIEAYPETEEMTDEGASTSEDVTSGADLSFGYLQRHPSGYSVSYPTVKDQVNQLPE